MPLHIVFYSFPFVLGIALPIISFIIWRKIQKDQTSHKQWLIVFAVTFSLFLTMIFTSVTGKHEKTRMISQVESNPSLIELLTRHETFSDIAVGLTAGLCFFSVLGCKAKASRSRQVLMYLSIFTLFPLWLAVSTGWELVHKHGVNNAYIQQQVK